MAQMTCSCNLELPKEAVISGTKGSIKVDVPFWCPTNMTTPKASKESRCTYDVSFFFFLQQFFFKYGSLAMLLELTKTKN